MKLKFDLSKHLSDKSRNKKLGKSNVPCGKMGGTLSSLNVVKAKFLEGLLSDKAKKLEGLVIFLSLAMMMSHKNRQLVFPLIYFRNTYKLKTRFNVKRVDTN